MGSRIAALGTFMKWRRERESAEENALCGVFYFMSFSVTVGQTSHNPFPLFHFFSVEPHDLNNETPVFCLLAVFLHITVAQGECLDHQSLSQRASLHAGDGDGFWMDFGLFFSSSSSSSSEAMSP